MIQFGSGPHIYIVFILSASLEFYFFMMQRSALELGRAAGFSDRDSRRMLPLWYLTVWPSKVVKWWAAISIGVEQHWVATIILLVAAFLFQTFAPIPHRQYISLFRRKLTREIGDAVQSGSGVESKIYARLYAALFEASKRF